MCQVQGSQIYYQFEDGEFKAQFHLITQDLTLISSETGIQNQFVLLSLFNLKAHGLLSI